MLAILIYRCTFRLLRATRLVLHPSRSLNQRFHSRIKIHPLISENYPASLALVRTRIMGFSALNTDEQLRAAALALKRDLGVDTAHIRLATRALNKDDEIAIAFASAPASALNSATADSTALSFPAAFFEAMQSDEIRWFGAPNGIAVGPGGSAAIEPHSVSTATVQNNALPNEIVTLLSVRGAPNRVALHDARDMHDTYDAHDMPSAETLALWSAATGATFTFATSNTFTSANRHRSRIALVAVSQATISKPRGALDRALMVACVASVICLGLATLQWVTGRAQLKNLLSSAPTSGTVSAQRTAIAGDLFARIATISPEVVRSMKSATYGGGAWIVSLNAPIANNANNASTTTTPPSTVKNLPTPDASILVNSAAAALRNNGFSVQAILQPEPRLRVQAP